jgi:hypothetical protein
MRVSSPVPKVIQQLLTCLLPRHLVTSICPCIFPSITCFRRQFLRKMWPIQLAFLFHISCRIFLCSLTLSNTSSFLTWSVPRASNTKSKSAVQCWFGHYNAPYFRKNSVMFGFVFISIYVYFGERRRGEMALCGALPHTCQVLGSNSFITSLTLSEFVICPTLPRK